MYCSRIFLNFVFHRKFCPGLPQGFGEKRIPSERDLDSPNRMATICPKLKSLNRFLKKSLFQKIHFDINSGQIQRHNEFFGIGIFLETDLEIVI